jgi:tetratricopeptide (TPR) repeat protein
MNPLVDAVGDANLPDSGELRSCVSSRRVATDPKPDDPDALPWGPSVPTPELAAMAQRAEETARHGFDLAERGALFSARGEFIDVLRNVAQAVDAQRSSTVHAKALAAGLRAMEEVDDFVPRGSRLETDVNLKLVVDAHRTPVLKHRSLERMQPLEAQRAYLSYAQEQLTSAAADQAVASLALHGLGKICLAPAEMHGPREQIAEAKAVVFFQAALIIEPNNFLAANELGVALARFGHLEDSRRVLLQAARTSNNPTSWRNLAAVYRRMGDQARADDARRQADSIVAKLQQNGNSTAGTRYPIQWVDVGTFTRNNSMVAGPPRPAAEAASAPAAETATKTDAKTGGWPWSMK